MPRKVSKRLKELSREGSVFISYGVGLECQKENKVYIFICLLF
jgi:hypothetical protein